MATESDIATPVYVLSDSDDCWVPALHLKTYNGRATVSIPVFKTEPGMMSSEKLASKQHHENKFVDLKEYPDEVLPLQNVDSDGNLEEYKDMVDLPFMHEVREQDQSVIDRTAANIADGQHCLFLSRRPPFCTILSCVIIVKSRTHARGTS